MAKSEHVYHGFGPFLPEGMKLLILGTFPSVKSREISFYYGNKQNLFWRLMADYFREVVPQSLEQKKAFLTRHGIGLYDVIEQCDIVGSSDSSIRHVVAADINALLGGAEVSILLNGRKATQIFHKYNALQARSVPSSSPANAAMKYEDKLKMWSLALDEIYHK